MGYIVGDQILKIIAEHKPMPQKLTISTNVKITNITISAIVIGGEKKQGATFEFLFTTAYGESGSKIEVGGSVVYVGEKKELEDIEKAWKDKKAITNEELSLVINNRALEIGLLQSITLAGQLRLPIPIMLPRFVPNQGENKEAKK